MTKQTMPMLAISDETLVQWQEIIDLLAEIAAVPAALIMRLKDDDIEVFVSSASKDNPYTPGDREHFAGSGLYCERVITTKEVLRVPDALADPEWRHNPDVKLNMISYLGFPLHLPDGRPFGTICVLDSKENAYSNTIERLMARFRLILEQSLELSHMNQVLHEENRSLSDYITEIKVLRGMVPICSFCKKIRDEAGQWTSLEEFMTEATEAQFTHSFCDSCMREHYPVADRP